MRDIIEQNNMLPVLKIDYTLKDGSGNAILKYFLFCVVCLIQLSLKIDVYLQKSQPRLCVASVQQLSFSLNNSRTTFRLSSVSLTNYARTFSAILIVPDLHLSDL